MFPPPSADMVIVNPDTRCVRVRSKMKHKLVQVMVVLSVALQLVGSPEQVTDVAPMIVRSFVFGRVIGVAQVPPDPDGTLIVSPLLAEVTQAATSVRVALAAVHVGDEPEQAPQASDGRSRLMLSNFRIIGFPARPAQFDCLLLGRR